MEIALHNQLAASGIPRFMTGDMNDRASYFCRVVVEAPLGRAPGRLLEQRRLRGRQARARWTGSSAPPELTWSGYIEDRSPLVARTTDHPMIVTEVTVDGSEVRPPPVPRRRRCRWSPAGLTVLTRAAGSRFRHTRVGSAAGYLSAVKWTPGVLALRDRRGLRGAGRPSASRTSCTTDSDRVPEVPRRTSRSTPASPTGSTPSEVPPPTGRRRRRAPAARSR